MKVGDVIVRIDERYYRPAEVETLLGDPTKAREKLGWETKITLPQMIEEMLMNDVDLALQKATLRSNGFAISTPME
jgi:GDPmannose 4,6-dehydratase